MLMIISHQHVLVLHHLLVVTMISLPAIIMDLHQVIYLLHSACTVNHLLLALHPVLHQALRLVVLHRHHQVAVHPHRLLVLLLQVDQVPHLLVLHLLQVLLLVLPVNHSVQVIMLNVLMIFSYNALKTHMLIALLKLLFVVMMK